MLPIRPAARFSRKEQAELDVRRIGSQDAGDPAAIDDRDPVADAPELREVITTPIESSASCGVRKVVTSMSVNETVTPARIFAAGVSSMASREFAYVPSVQNSGQCHRRGRRARSRR